MTRDDTMDAVLEANATFYRAFGAGDFAMMERLWSDDDEIACVHPGWPPVHGRDKVIETWAGILAQPPQPAIRVIAPKATVAGPVAWVICFEAIGDLYLVATNVFIADNGTWRMVHHHSGQTEQAPEDEDATDETPEARTLH